MRKLLLALTSACLLGLVQSQSRGADAGSTPRPTVGPINVRSFLEHVVNPGSEQEDWQPAFQRAIEVAQRGIRPILVPAGVYKIRKAIRITPVPREDKRNPFGFHALRIVGEGRHQTSIVQQVDTENVIDWTGLEYKNPCNHGELAHIGIGGGKIGLNIKWHNYFSLDTCYIHGCKEYGIYAEGWSSRFRNSIIRWCFEAGIWAGVHFNNCVIRDCYFSRDGIGIHFMGGYGNRIEGCGLEVCAKAAIFVRGGNSLTINNCYFEGNGYKGKHKDLFNVQGWANTIHLDYSCTHVNVHDNIFRANLDQEGACLSICYTIKCHVYDNTFHNTTNGIKLRPNCETNRGAKPHFGQLIVERNSFTNVKNPLLEDKPGLIELALSQGSAFRLRRKATCEGCPVAAVRPECIGDEILDLKAKKWYKAVGPKTTDWVPLN